MKTLRELKLYYSRSLRVAWSTPAYRAIDLLTPLLYMLFFAPILANISQPALTTAQVLNSFVPRVLTLLAFGSGTGAGWGIIRDLDGGVIERFQVTPTSRFALMLGSVLSTTTTFLGEVIVTLIISTFFGFSIHLGGLLLLVLLLAFLNMLVCAASAALAMKTKNISSLASIVNGIQLPLTLLSGVLLPMTLAPKWLLAIAHINPLYYTVQASHDLAAGTIVSHPVILGYSVIVIFTIIVLIWATRTYQKSAA